MSLLDASQFLNQQNGLYGTAIIPSRSQISLALGALGPLPPSLIALKSSPSSVIGT